MNRACRGVVATLLTGPLLLGGAGAAAAATGTPSPTPTASPTASPTTGEVSPGTPTGSSTDSPTGTPTGSPTAVEPDPLRVVIDRLSPSVMPTSGRITVAGRVTNRSDAPWTALSAYLVTSSEPLTTEEEVATAVASDPRTDIGGRIVDPFEFLPDLDPGESTRFRLDVPRAALTISGEPGVYWLGVHILGTTDGLRLEGADGRARTFLPLVPGDAPRTRLALGVQFRSHVVRTTQGTLAYPDTWRGLVRHSGRLSRLLALSETAQQAPLAWVVDPAVVEAAGSLAVGNPGFTDLPGAVPGVDAVTGDGTDGSGSASGPSSSATDESPETSPDAGGGGDETPGSARAAAWLDDFAHESDRHHILALPYGDLDVDAAYRWNAGAMVTNALDVGQQVLEGYSIDATRAVAPPDGYLGAGALSGLGADVLTVLDPAVVPSIAPPVGPPVAQRVNGADVLLAGPAASTQGPGPGAPRAALAVRQRILADAAVHSLEPTPTRPMVVMLPVSWDPGRHWRRADFFDGLDVPWLDLSSLGQVRKAAVEHSSDGLATVDESTLVAPEGQVGSELALPIIDDVEELVVRAATYAAVLTEQRSVGTVISRQALLGASVWSRQRPGVATDRVRGTLALLTSQLGQISVRGPRFVTLSSEGGSFQVTLVNGLDQPVEVGLLLSVTGGGLQLSSPGPVTLAAHERRAMPIEVQGSSFGVHQVLLRPVTTTGQPVGSTAVLSVRSSHVGFIVWLIMIGGGVVLFGAIAVRLVRRVLRRRATHGPLLRGPA